MLDPIVQTLSVTMSRPCLLLATYSQKTTSRRDGRIGRTFVYHVRELD